MNAVIQEVSDNARQILESSIVWENHACMPLRPGDTSFLDQLSRYKAAGATVVSLNVGFDATEWHQAFKLLATFRTWVQQQDDYVLAESVEDIEQAHSDGRLAVLFDLEGGVGVDDTPELIEPYYALGVRWMLIAYNRNNRLGGGCQDDDSGLTDFGRKVIDEMERVGMVLCCSHTGHKTAFDAIQYSNNPVIFSHSNPDAVHAHDRNIPDELIKAAAEKGGVINVNGIGEFLGLNDNRSETYVAHVQYVADLVGPEHVGMGLDYVFDEKELEDFLKNNPELFPPEKGYKGSGMKMVAPEQIPEIVDLLLSAGWSDDNVRGFLGGNNMRVAKQVWK